MDAFAEWLTPFLSGDSLLVLPLVILGGLITAFNPCCLPMYPAVFGFIGGICCKNNTVSRSLDSQNTSQSSEARPMVSITFLFILGMATATSIMGMLTAGLGWVFGQFDTRLLRMIAVVPLLMGLNLLGILPIQLPAWHSTKLHVIAGKNLKHKITAFSAGLLFSLAIAPCATPVLLGILTLVAMKGDVAYGSILMFIYGLGAGMPLLLVGYGFKKSQKWLFMPLHQKWLRCISGLLLIGTSIYIVW